MGRGRKSLYKDHLFKEGLKLAFHGFTLDQMADFWEVGASTLRRWINRYPEFRTALRRAKQEADFKVEKGLYKRAIGFSYTERTYERRLIKTKAEDGNGQPKEQHQMVLIKRVKKHICPDHIAGFIWLKNRDPMKWRDVQERKVLGLFAEMSAEEIYALKKKAEKDIEQMINGSKEKKLNA